MPNLKINEFNFNTNPNFSDVIPIINNDETKQITLSGLTNFIGPSIRYISVIYSEFYNLISTGNLIAHKFYLISDFQTVYDVPDYYLDGSPKNNYTGYSASYGVVEPVIVYATSANTIDLQAYQPAWPNDLIKYDWTFNSTEVTTTPAFGRITERIDSHGNRTDYDHRNIDFIRYESYTINTQLTGNITDMSITGVLSGTGCNFTTEIITNEPIILDTLASFGYNISINITTIIDNNTLYFDYDTNFPLSFSGQLFTGYSASHTGVFDRYKEFYIAQKTDNNYQLKPTFQFNTTYNVFVGDKARYSDILYYPYLLANNVFGINCYVSSLGNRVFNNTFGDSFTNNTIGNDILENTIGDYFFKNNIGNDFQGNIVLYGFASNVIGNDFIFNNIANSFFNNIVGNNFFNNNVGNDFRGNSVGIEFQGNKINYNCDDNVFGNNFKDNVIGYDFKGNQIGNYFINNIIGIVFSGNKVNNYFDGNNIANNYFKNIVGSNFIGNTIGSNSHDNTIGNSFSANTIGTNFYYNIIGNDVFNNVVDSDCYYNIIGNYCYGNNILYKFISNNIVGNFHTNTIDEKFTSNEIKSSFFNNTVGRDCIFNVFYNNFTNNTVAIDFRNNVSYTDIDTTDFLTSTLVYYSFTCEIIKNSDNVNRLRYTDSSDNLKYNAITD